MRWESISSHLASPPMQGLVEAGSSRTWPRRTRSPSQPVTTLARPINRAILVGRGDYIPLREGKRSPDLVANFIVCIRTQLDSMRSDHGE